MLANAAGLTDQLISAVDDVAAESVDDLSTHAIGDQLVALRRQIDRLEAQFTRRLARFHQHRGAQAEGSVNTESWLRGTCGLTGPAAAERVRMASILEKLPLAAESFRDGEMPFANASLIVRLASDVGVEAARVVEQTLVTAAETVDSGEMRFLTAATRLQIDAAGVLDQDNRAHARRWFSCDRGAEGVFLVRGELDAEGGAIVKTAIDALCGLSGPGDERSGAQRRADALVDLASGRLRGADVRSVHGQRPHLVLTTSIEALRGQEGEPPPEIRGVGPVHLQTARRLACDASRTVAVVSGPAGASRLAVDGAAGAPVAEGAAGAPVAEGAAGAQCAPVAEPAGSSAGDRSVSVGRATRIIPAPMRTALALRDRGCRFPKCDRPPEWTDGHHIEHWADLGETEVPNLVLLCRRHHRMVHEDGWQIRLEPDGSVTVTEPRGRPPTKPLHS